MTEERCFCAACRAGDALPERLAGWPGAYQLNLLKAQPRKPPVMMTQDQALRDLCADKCAEFGDPPCYELDQRAARLTGEPPAEFKPCDECKRALGLEPPEPLDENAVVRPLL